MRVMKKFTVHQNLWSSVLLLWASQSGSLANNRDACVDKIPGDSTLDSEQGKLDVKEPDPSENFLCLLYPTDLLNCSWSFSELHTDAQLSVSISVCEGDAGSPSPILESESRVASKSSILRMHKDLKIILQFNISLHNEWAVYGYTYNVLMMEVLPPPQNLSASFKDGDLLVSWSLPRDIKCLEYQLDMGDQKEPRTYPGLSPYKEQNADPGHAYRVRIRTRKTEDCQDRSQWSDWSHTVTIWPVSNINMLVIVSICLGVPMILLAVLLLVRHQRVSKVLFPPVPRPAKKYKSFLEKTDTFNFFHQALSVEQVEEITVVEDAHA